MGGILCACFVTLGCSSGSPEAPTERTETPVASVRQALTVHDYAATVLGDAPVGYWRLGERSATTAVDATSSNNNGA
jgi:hypothetical protein